MADHEAAHYCCVVTLADEEFSRLCPACSDMCYKATPIWSWDEQSIHSIVSSGRLHSLHSQICLSYQRFRAQVPSQQLMRKSAASRVRRSAHRLWPSCQVHMYGSSASGLFLRSSDIDLLILNSGCSDTVSALDTLAQHLGTPRGRFSSFEVLRNAKVPILRFYEQQSMLSFDVRVECGPMDSQPLELKAVQIMRDSLVKLPAMGPLYMRLKTFLEEKELNKLFQQGGIRPYMLFVMLKTFLHLAEGLMHPEPSAYASPNLGLLLLGFLHFYGKSFKSERYGISCRQAGDFPEKGCFFSKQPEFHACGSCPIIEHKGFHNRNMHLLAVEDPLNPSNNLGKNSRNYRHIQGVFRQAYADLISPSSQLLHSFIPKALADEDDLVLSFSRMSSH